MTSLRQNHEKIINNSKIKQIHLIIKCIHSSGHASKLSFDPNGDFLKRIYSSELFLKRFQFFQLTLKITSEMLLNCKQNVHLFDQKQ